MNRQASSQCVNFSLCLVQFTFGACNKMGFLEMKLNFTNIFYIKVFSKSLFFSTFSAGRCSLFDPCQTEP